MANATATSAANVSHRLRRPLLDLLTAPPISPSDDPHPTEPLRRQKNCACSISNSLCPRAHITPRIRLSSDAVRATIRATIAGNNWGGHHRHLPHDSMRVVWIGVSGLPTRGLAIPRSDDSPACVDGLYRLCGNCVTRIRVGCSNCVGRWWQRLCCLLRGTVRRPHRRFVGLGRGFRLARALRPRPCVCRLGPGGRGSCR